MSSSFSTRISSIKPSIFWLKGNSFGATSKVDIELPVILSEKYVTIKPTITKLLAQKLKEPLTGNNTNSIKLLDMLAVSQLVSAL